MTEDDTFKRLKRLPFEEVRQLRANLIRTIFLSEEFAIRMKDALENNGWTSDEYMKEYTFHHTNIRDESK